MLSKSGIRIGVALPQGFEDGNIDVGLIRAYATQAEKAGYDDLWTIEQIIGRFPVLEPVSLLNYLAAITERIRLGTAVLVTNLRNPLQLAKSLSTLDHLSNGRLTAGIGLGTTTRTYPAFGMSEERRVGRFLEGLRVMKALWTESSTTAHGEFWKLENVGMEPKPVQKPHPPVWIGAHSEAAMRRAARHADGWMGAGSTDLGVFFEEIARMREILAEEGRDAATFPLSKRIYIAVDDDETKAREQLSACFGAFYGRPDVVDSWGVYGSASRVLETLNQMREAGLTHLMLHPAPTDLRHLEVLTEKIAPQL
jgi:probable F420-dependent oxidoreductase